MRKIAITLCAVAGLAALAWWGWSAWNRAFAPDEPLPPVEWSADLQAVADGNNRFACDLYGRLREEKGNLLFSPYSVHTALSMTAVGAGGSTRDQMVKVLHLPADEDKMLAAGDLGRFYGHPRKAYDLSVANAIWGAKGYGWRPEFVDVQKKRFGGGFQEADFAGDPDAARDRINRWVEAQTRDRIKELLLQEHVTRRTTMVLVNAIYFKGAWVTEFDPKKTRNAPFHCADDTRVEVPMMHTNVKCGHLARDGMQMVELPYKGGDLSMIVILPQLPNGLPAVEKQLTAEALAAWTRALRDRADLEVSLPKFRVESRFELPKDLKALGMIDAFGDADFTGMAPGSTEPISHVVHKAFVEVNEEGTEAAAATAVARRISSDTLPFYADHPFLFLIRDTKRGTILFMGRVEKP